jgi:hypothetical protein
MHSPLAVPASQVRRSLWTVNGIASGIMPADIVYPAAYGPNKMAFGHMYGNSTHRPALQRLATEGGDPFGANAWKTSSYSPAMSGNLGTGVPDMHFARATLHTSEHMKAYQQYLQAQQAWEGTYREVLLQTGSKSAAKRAAGNIPQYGGPGTVIGDINAPAGRTGTAKALIDHGDQMAAQVGAEAGTYQGNVWVAARHFTGVDSPAPLHDIITAQIEELSRGSGVPVDDILRAVFTGQLPLEHVIGPELMQDVLRNAARVQHAIDRARADGHDVDEEEDLFGLLNLTGGW